MGLCRTHWSAPVSPRENKYIHKPLFVHLRGGSAATIKVLMLQRQYQRNLWAAQSHHWKRQGRPGCLVGRLADQLTGPASLSLTQSCGCTQWKQLIPLFYGEEGGGGLTSNNSALSLEMSAVTPGDCPTGQRHFRKKPRYKISVENSMKPCDEGNETG